MKKLLSLIPVMLMMMLMAACTKADPTAVAEKVNSGDELTAADYKAMIDYNMGAFDGLIDLLNSAKEGKIKAEDVESEMTALSEKYEYADIFEKALGKAEIPEECKAAYAKYEEKQKEVQTLFLSLLGL